MIETTTSENKSPNPVVENDLPISSKETSVSASHGAFADKIAILPADIQQKLNAQLDLMPEDAVYEIVETHGGVTVLYKSFDQAKEASVRRDSIVDAQGARIFTPAKAKLGDTYYTGKDEETATFTLGKLVEFQITGLLVVMIVIISLCALSYLMTAVLRAIGVVKPDTPTPPVPSPSPVPQALKDPNAKSEHPGFTNAQLQAFLTTAAVAAIKEFEVKHHPVLSNEQLAIIFAIAAAEVLGSPCNVIKFRPMNAMDWTWAVQGHNELHSNRL